MHEHLSQRLSGAKQIVELLTKIQRKPSPLNNPYYSDYKDKFLTYYRRVLKDSESYEMGLGAESEIFGAQQISLGPKEPATAALNTPEKIEYHGSKAEDLAKLHGQDKMEPAMEVMATVRAYFQGISSHFFLVM